MNKAPVRPSGKCEDCKINHNTLILCRKNKKSKWRKVCENCCDNSHS